MTNTADPGQLSNHQLVALYGLYRGLVKQASGRHQVYGKNVTRALEQLADLDVINRTGMGAYMIPWGGRGEQIVTADPDFCISDHL